ncbi:Uncharacterised protein [Klebsiella pneumoniae]|nr:Uncharacterised protein [Klebsiella pneumoniae]
MPFPRSSYRQYVIQRHNHIGNGDGDRGAPQAARAANLALFFLIPDQLDANPQQEQRADYFQPRQRQEIQSDRQQQNARQDGAHGTDDDRFGAFLRRQFAAGHGDHHGIVATQQ